MGHYILFVLKNFSGLLVTWVPFNGFLKFCLGSQICGDNCVMAIEAKSWRKAADYQRFGVIVCIYLLYCQRIL
ncbi:hypothetical protein ACB092_04G161900 [Castanea dentata]